MSLYDNLIEKENLLLVDVEKINIFIEDVLHEDASPSWDEKVEYIKAPIQVVSATHGYAAE